MSAIEVILLWLLLSVLAVAWSVTRSLERDRNDWRRAASSLAVLVRGLDTWPVVETVVIARVGERLSIAHPRRVSGLTTVVDEHKTVVPIPPCVAVIGRPAALDRWSTNACKALAEYDALVDPEGR